jgi:SAM-dependent methyltransferase
MPRTRGRFFENSPQEEQLEASNEVFWNCLLQHIRDDYGDAPPSTVLDVGSHRGGLLVRLARMWSLRQVYGIEPLSAARKVAAARLQTLIPDVCLLDTTDWERLPAGAIELVTCHEVLYLEPDLKVFMARLHRVLAPSGRAYVVLGCHSDNPIWPHWKPLLEAMGHLTYDHRPMDILATAGAQGLIPSVRPLRSAGWITHDPRGSAFTFPDVATMMDHHFKHKLLFRFTRA